MREIEFRAYLLKEKRMADVKSIHFGTKKIMYGYSINNQQYGNKSCSFNDCQLMQFTGLTDKNGNKIFEGDIITADCYPFIDNDKQNYVGIIEYIDELSSFEYILQCVNSEKRGISNGINEELEGNEDLICEDFEVIGNIYDNPELLEAKNE